MKISIPKSLVPPAKLLWQMSVTTLRGLNEHLEAERATLRATTLDGLLAEILDSSGAERLGALLLGLHMQRSRDVGPQRDSEAEYISAVVQSLRDLQDDSDEPPAAGDDSFRLELGKLLGDDSPIAVPAKASDLNYFDEKQFQEVQIVSDIRPIFDGADEGSVSAAIVVHGLKIDFFDTSTRHSEAVLVKLDTDDLREMRDAVDRALEKDLRIREFVREAGARTLFTGEKEEN